MERVRHDVTITERGQGIFRWHCSCGASSGEHRSASAADALNSAEAHVEPEDEHRSG